jgi:putative flippase GtrA
MGNGAGREYARFALAGVAGLAVDIAVLYLALALAGMMFNFASAKLLVFRT